MEVEINLFVRINLKSSFIHRKLKNMDVVWTYLMICGKGLMDCPLAPNFYAGNSQTKISISAKYPFLIE
jgi:hypothetical protein